MRGAPTGWCPGRRKTRIIPADAGSTEETAWALHGWADHPRGCGEHVSVLASQRETVGSSPRMRGAPPVTFFF